MKNNPQIHKMGDIVEHISDKDLELYKVHKDSFFFFFNLAAARRSAPAHRAVTAGATARSRPLA